MKTQEPLEHDFMLLALPDACVNLLFNQCEIEVAGITALRTTHEVLNLGRSFHFVGIELMPGTWRGDRREIQDQYVGTPYKGELPLIAVSREMATHEFAGKQRVMTAFVEWLISAQWLHGRPGQGGTLVYFSVDDCAEEQARVASAGGKLVRPKFSIGEFGWVALCEDTEGDAFGLSSMR